MRHTQSLRICVVVPYDLSQRGGVKHHALEVARALRREGDEVTIIGPSASDQSVEGIETFGGIMNIRSNASDNRIALFVSPPRLWRFFGRRRFDVIHLHEPPVPAITYWGAWLTPGIPKVATFHAFSEVPSPLVRLGQRVSALLQCRFIDRSLAVSGSARRHAARAWHKPITVIPNGVDTDVFTPRAFVDRGDDTIRLLFIGRQGEERKGLRYLLEAYQILRARGLRVTLDIIGEQTATPPAGLEGLRYHGSLPRSELRKRFHECDIFVAPATGQESFGIVLLEAMATGAPIICSDIEGFREVVHPYGALRVPPRDSGALAEAITQLAGAPQIRAAMGAVNVRHVQQYAWPCVAARIREEYLAAIAAVTRRDDHHLPEPRTVPLASPAAIDATYGGKLRARASLDHPHEAASIDGI